MTILGHRAGLSVSGNMAVEMDDWIKANVRGVFSTYISVVDKDRRYTLGELMANPVIADPVSTHLRGWFELEEDAVAVQVRFSSA